MPAVARRTKPSSVRSYPHFSDAADQTLAETQYPESKVINFEHASVLFENLRKRGTKIVHCHGTFDMVHPGHIVHFEEAKALGDILVVTITAEKFVNKGPGRPYFNDQMRSRWLAALECVDFVVVIPFAAAVEAIECVGANYYCKGREYENTENDVTGNIHDDLTAVKRVGGEIKYVGSIVFSSTRLINQHFEPYPPEVKSFCHRIARDYSPDRFRKIVEEFKKLRVLVVGDIILDRYTTLQVQGLTSKNRILSGRFMTEETHAGGALAVFRHLSEFTQNVKLVGMVGDEPWLDDALSPFIKAGDHEIVRSKDFTTVIKQRFVEPRSEGKELSKLFSVNYIDQNHPKEILQKQVIERIAGHIDDYDLVLVMDFGHGVLSDSVRDYVQDKARFLAVNCQTNSNNHGFNIINRRYRRADAFTVDQTELNLAVGKREIDYGRELGDLAVHLNSKYAWLTRGASTTIGRNCVKEPCLCAAFERSVVDTVGAGDAFCAVASLAAVSGLPLNLATFMGQLAGAQAVRVIGNSEPIRKSKFLKGAASMLAF